MWKSLVLMAWALLMEVVFVIAISWFKHYLNKKIKAGLPKPVELKQEFWDALINLQEEPGVKANSELMASITQGRPLLAESKARRDSTVSALVSIAWPMLSDMSASMKYTWFQWFQPGKRWRHIHFSVT
jgi:hypothetical protein